MLKNLSIKNYALIQSLHINFNNGFTAVTGETGAGKSIILGAMHLMLGQRADTSVIRNTEEKCIAEGVFDISNYQLKPLFEEYELDYWDETILRREILPSGKTRAFVNDTPVTLQVLKSIASRLIDIHSQSQNLEIENKAFQLSVVDASAQNDKLKESYKQAFKLWQKTQNQLADLISQSAQAASEQEFLQFQFEKLDEANLVEDEEETLEAEQQILSHAEEIKSALEQISHYLEGDENSVIQAIASANKSASGIASFIKEAYELAERLDSLKIELADIAAETASLNEQTEFDPERLAFVNERLSLLFGLKQKHNVDSVNELIHIKKELEERLLESDNLSHDIERLQKRTKEQEQEVMKLAEKLSQSRQKAFSGIENYIHDRLKYMGMASGQIKIDLKQLAAPTLQGLDEITFLFSANKSHPLNVLSNVASGGEKSRLMLIIKSLLAENKSLPTIIFDEIDTGISGDIAQKLAGQLSILARNMQLIVITHLPQVASRGTNHLKVYKEENHEGTTTSIKILDENARILELAEMLSGKNPPEAAILNARELLNTALES